jgi:hypothetical protein
MIFKTWPTTPSHQNAFSTLSPHALALSIFASNQIRFGSTHVMTSIFNLSHSLDEQATLFNTQRSQLLFPLSGRPPALLQCPFW